MNWMSNSFNPLSANPTKWSITLKQFIGILATNCLSVLDHFVGLALKRLRQITTTEHTLQKTEVKTAETNICSKIIMAIVRYVYSRKVQRKEKVKIMRFKVERCDNRTQMFCFYCRIQKLRWSNIYSRKYILLTRLSPFMSTICRQTEDLHLLNL